MRMRKCCFRALRKMVSAWVTLESVEMHVHSPDNYLRVCRKLHTISIHFANKSPKLHDPLESYCTDSAIWHIRYIVYIIYIYKFKDMQWWQNWVTVGSMFYVGASWMFAEYQILMVHWEIISWVTGLRNYNVRRFISLLYVHGDINLWVYIR